MLPLTFQSSLAYAIPGKAAGCLVTLCQETSGPGLSFLHELLSVILPPALCPAFFLNRNDGLRPHPLPLPDLAFPS